MTEYDKMDNKKGYVHSIESFGSVDGTGVRFIIFLAGCAMRCDFCHNPDTWDMKAGKMMSAEELIEKALRYKAYWGKDGGITVSGGEPLMQMDFLTEIMKEAKKNGINTAIDTAGQPFGTDKEYLEKFDELMKYTDLVMLDIKHIDNDEHMRITGMPNKNILEMARYLDKIGKDVWIRHVLVTGGSDDDVYLEKLAEFVGTLGNVRKVEVLPYHSLGEIKYEKLGIKYRLKGLKPPSEERIRNAERILAVKK